MGRGVRLTSLGAAALSLHPATITDELSQGTGSHLAAVAAELRWEQLILALLLLLAAFRALGRPSHRMAAILAAHLTLWCLLTHSEASNEVGAAAPETTSLWGAPAHLLSALLCCAGALLLAATQAARLWLPCWPSVALLLLGLAWNLLQGSGSKSWVWDWIEVGPLLSAGGWISCTHPWSSAASGGPWPALYLSFLQTSRASLLASAHHLQPPMAPRYQLASNPGVLCSPAAAAGLGDKLVKSLLFAVPLACLLSRPSGVAAWPQAPKHHPRVALRPYPLPSHTLWAHLFLATASTLALAPLWGVLGGGAFLSSWLWFGWLGTHNRGLRAALRCWSYGVGHT